MTRERLKRTIDEIRAGKVCPPDLDAVATLERAGIVGRDGPFCIIRGYSEKERAENADRVDQIQEATEGA